MLGKIILREIQIGLAFINKMNYRLQNKFLKREVICKLGGLKDEIDNLKITKY